MCWECVQRVSLFVGERRLELPAKRTVGRAPAAVSETVVVARTIVRTSSTYFSKKKTMFYFVVTICQKNAEN